MWKTGRWHGRTRRAATGGAGRPCPDGPHFPERARSITHNAARRTHPWFAQRPRGWYKARLAQWFPPRGEDSSGARSARIPASAVLGACQHRAAKPRRWADTAPPRAAQRSQRGAYVPYFARLPAKGVQSGNNVSHANNKTRRRWLPNLRASFLGAQREPLDQAAPVQSRPAHHRQEGHRGGHRRVAGPRREDLRRTTMASKRDKIRLVSLGRHRPLLHHRQEQEEHAGQDGGQRSTTPSSASTWPARKPRSSESGAALPRWGCGLPDSLIG